jgi:hypothetical protein
VPARLRRLLVLGAALLAVGCSRTEGRGQAGGAAPVSSPAASGGAASGAQVVSADILRAVCTQKPCGDEHSSVQVYRDAGGKVARLYRTYGGCFHSPGIYFDPDGTQRDLVPEQPVVKGSPEAEALKLRHDRQVVGLTAAETLRCKDALRPPP